MQKHLTPKGMWLALQHERRSIAIRMHLKQVLILLRQGNANLRIHFLKFDQLIRDLKSTGTGIDELDVICHLLISLNPVYEMVVTSIKTVPEHHVSLEFVKCRLLEEETTRSADSELVTVKAERAAFSGSNAWKSQPQQQQPKKKKMEFKCFGCGQA